MAIQEGSLKQTFGNLVNFLVGAHVIRKGKLCPIKSTQESFCNPIMDDM
jgi:hypothetical protein